MPFDPCNELSQWLDLTAQELAGADLAERSIALSVTPYYLGLCETRNPNCPIRRQVVPSMLESVVAPGETPDSLGEISQRGGARPHSAVPDRALLLVHDGCAVYCRFCTRSRWVGQSGGARSLARLTPAFDYLRQHPDVREVIVSGGDPMTMSTAKIVELLAELRRIDSIETIRLATRAPVTLPQRITDELVSALRPFHPIWVMTHFNHIRELTTMAQLACLRFVDAGFPVMNQTVLLRGVNMTCRR